MQEGVLLYAAAVLTRSLVKEHGENKKNMWYGNVFQRWRVDQDSPQS